MLANQDMNVVGHDRTGVAGQLFVMQRVLKCVGDGVACRGVEGESGMLQKRFGILQELPHDRTGRLNGFSPKMQFAKLAEKIVAQGEGSTAARIVGKPPS